MSTDSKEHKAVKEDTSSHMTTGDYAVLMETSGENFESWYYFIRVEGNEENLKHLQSQLEDVDWYILDDLSTFDLDLDHYISAATAKEMTKVELNHSSFHRKFDGKLKKIDLGFGKKDNSLISQYIVNKQIIDGKTDFDISYKFDLQIPNYNIVDSEWYRQQFYEYIVKKHNEENQSGCNNVNKSNHLLQELEELHLQQEVVKKNMLHDVFENIIDNKN